MKPYQQTTAQSCLAVCLLQLYGKTPSQEEELKLLYKGLFDRKNYLMGILSSFARRYPDTAVKVYVDNKYYCKELSDQYYTKNIQFVCAKVSKVLIDRILPVVIEIDLHTFGTWEHSPHFIVVKSSTKQFYTILDSLPGKKSRIGKKHIEKSIYQLRNIVRFCPIAITVEKKGA